jgi:hypothetical protein
MNRFLLMLLVLAAMALPALAQSNTGTLTGTISDASGTIPGATVVVKDNNTGKEKTVTTSSEGTFNVPQLEVGTYTITVTAPGHKSHTATDLKIDVGREYTLNPTLEVGDVNENVSVVAGADIVNSSNGELSNTVSTRQIVELPLNGRNPLSLVLLQAGTSSNSAQATTINGQRSSFTNITRDGLNIQDNFIRANAVDFVPDRPNVDDTGEFTIVTQNAGAEAGYGSSQVQLVTPRGSNEFHGAGYLYNRNSVAAANSFFGNVNGQTRPFLNRNQFGGKVSGPIWKNKIFFFGAYEKFLLHQSTSSARTILLPSARTGNFTFIDSKGLTQTVNLFSPAFSAVSGVSGIDPIIASRILANLPTAGNTTAQGDQLNTTGLTFNQQSNQTRDAYSMRFDWDITDRQSFNVVYTYKKEFLLRPDVDGQQGGVAAGFNVTPFGSQFAHTPFTAMAWRWSPTNTLTNEIRGGYQGSDPTFNSNQPDPAFFLRIPLINNPENGFQKQGRDTKIYNAQDNATWLKGNHSIRFGGQFQAFRVTPFGPGAFGASTIPTQLIGGGNTFAYTTTTFNAASGCVTNPSSPDFNKFCLPAGQLGTLNSLNQLLGGLVGSATIQFNAKDQTSGYVANQLPTRKLYYETYSAYVSDQWKISPNLSLNLGLRYDYFTPIREPNGLALEPVIKSGQTIQEAIMDPNGTYNFVGTNSGGHNFFKSDRNNFAPIVSFAYSPQFKNKFLSMLAPGEGRTVIRGGFRMSYVNDEFVRAADNALAGNAGLSTTATTGNIDRRPSTVPTIATPLFQVPRTYLQNDSPPISSFLGTVFAIDPNLQVPHTYEFNIGFEREIGFQTALEVRYVHGESHNLVAGRDLNQVLTTSNGFLEEFNRARNNQIRFGNPICTVAVQGSNCQPLQLFTTAAFNGTSALGNGTLRNNLIAGNLGDVAENFASLGANRSFIFPNPNTGGVDFLKNGSQYNYNALQVEARRRFSHGLTLQANYTFGKTLTDSAGTGQTRFDPLIDNANPHAEYQIADFDTTHVFNINTIYELPFGKGKSFFSGANGVVDRIIGGWQVTSIVRWTSGTPLSIVDPRGTLNRTARSARESASTNLTKEQMKALQGVYKTPCGTYFINPAVIDINLTTCKGTGRAALGFGQATFAGQAFFNVAPGTVGNIERMFLRGPGYFNWDASLIKNIPITERVRFQIRAEAFNVLNHANFASTQFANINSATFGRLSTTYAPRIIQFVGRIEF